jgi:hypothetical protein
MMVAISACLLGQQYLIGTCHRVIVAYGIYLHFDSELPAMCFGIVSFLYCKRNHLNIYILKYDRSQSGR